MASRAVPGLSAQLEDLPVVQGHAPWPGHEYARGWGVFALPFDSGHVLALRVFPANDFSPYRAVWHRDPNDRWSIHVDGPRLDTACPRYFARPATSPGTPDRTHLDRPGQPARDHGFTRAGVDPHRDLDPHPGPTQHDERGDAARHLAPAIAHPGPRAPGQHPGNGPVAADRHHAQRPHRNAHARADVLHQRLTGHAGRR